LTHRHLPSFPTRRSSDLSRTLITCSNARCTSQSLVVTRGSDSLLASESLVARVPIQSLLARPFLLSILRAGAGPFGARRGHHRRDRKSTRLNSSHVSISY